MALKQTGQDDHYGSNGQVDQSGVELQAMRAGFGTVLKPKPERTDKLPLFWQVFGGTILSIAALAFVTIYNNLTSNITEFLAAVLNTLLQLFNDFIGLSVLFIAVFFAFVVVGLVAVQFHPHSLHVVAGTLQFGHQGG